MADIEPVVTKYTLTDDTRNIHGTIVNRIMATRNFGSVVVGQLGGFVEKESNLSHRGGCWIADEAMAMNDSTVKQNAWMKGRSQIMGSAALSGAARIFGRVILHGNVVVYGNVQIHNNTQVGGSISLRGDLMIYSQEDVIDFLRRDRENKNRQVGAIEERDVEV